MADVKPNTLRVQETRREEVATLVQSLTESMLWQAFANAFVEAVPVLPHRLARLSAPTLDGLVRRSIQQAVHFHGLTPPSA